MEMGDGRWEAGEKKFNGASMCNIESDIYIELLYPRISLFQVYLSYRMYEGPSVLLPEYPFADIYSALLYDK